VALVLSSFTSVAAAQPQDRYDLDAAAQAGVVLATIFAISALVGILIMLLFALREIHKTGPRAT
jgi:hypothetical protein